jgi:hypothetical protein
LPAEARSGELPKATTVTVGSRVRIVAPTMVHGALEGMMLEMDDSSLLVGIDDRGPTRLSRQAITRIDVSTGRHSRALKGMIIGAVLGAGAGALAYSGDCNGAVSVCVDSHSVVPVGLVTGALVGAGIGALIKHDRWNRVPLDSVRVGLGPTRGRGVALSVSLGL